MDLESFKRWHWVLIGLVAGILYSSVRLFQGHDLGDNPTYEQNFELALLATPDAPAGAGSDEGSIYLTDVRVLPPEEISVAMFNASHRTAPAARAAPPQFNWPWTRKAATAKPKPAPAEPPKPPPGAAVVDIDAKPASQTGSRKINWVTGIVHRRYRDKKTRRELPEVTQTFRYAAPVPFTPYPGYDFATHPAPYLKVRPQTGYTLGGSKQYPNVTAYLDELKRIYGSGAANYRYAWWESRAAISTIYPFAGIVIIGGIWPTLLNLMIGAGLGRKKTARGEYDLSRFKGSGKAAMPKTTATLTAEDHRRLAELEAAMERDLEPAMAHAAACTAPAAPEPAVRALAATQVDIPELAADQTIPHKTFGASGGDFYPTEIHKPSEVNADS